MHQGVFPLDRPVDECLAQFEVRRTSDFASFCSGLQETFSTPSTSLRLAKPQQTGVSTIHAARLTDMTLGVVQVGSDVQAQVGPMPGYQVVIALHGGVIGYFAGEPVDIRSTTASINAPGQGVILPAWAASTGLLMLRFRPEAVRRAACELAGRDIPEPPRFRHSFELDTPEARSWLRTVALLIGELSEAGSLGRTSASHRSDLERLVITSLLRASDNDFSLSSQADRPAPRWASVRRALRAMEDDPVHDWTLAELATVAGVSGRRLQQAFREQVGLSPMEQLRALRLLGARRALLDDADPVAAVAAHWGFHHLGRFAGAYGARFGETPSETRRRARTVLVD
ncbi:AraC family transcriptional regulator [Agromyces soli]